MNTEKVLPLLIEIELLPEGTTGAFVFGPADKPVGTVLVEDGQICWAAAAKTGKRLTCLIEERANGSIEKGLIQMVFDECRLTGAPVGETLVERGILSPETFREVLLEHTVESFKVLMSETEMPPQWVTHRRKGYNPQFTFSTHEVFQRLEHMDLDGKMAESGNKTDNGDTVATNC